MQRNWLANADYFFDPVVCRLCGGQGRIGRCRPHGTASSEVCRRHCHCDRAFGNFMPATVQNFKGLAAPRLCRLFDATPTGGFTGAAMERKGGELATVVGPRHRHD